MKSSWVGLGVREGGEFKLCLSTLWMGQTGGGERELGLRTRAAVP